jgi:Trk-type K+ transport system membrane component
MASKVLALLTWQNKEESLKSFLGLNLFFYLVVFEGYSLVSLISSVAVVFILAINAHSMVHKSKFEEADVEFLSRHVLEDVFVEVWSTFKSLTEKVEDSSGSLILSILGIYFFEFWVGLFGFPVLAWVLVNLGYLAGPSYKKNQELIDRTLEETKETISGLQQMLFQMIPKHRSL